VLVDLLALVGVKPGSHVESGCPQLNTGQFIELPLVVLVSATPVLHAGAVVVKTAGIVADA